MVAANFGHVRFISAGAGSGKTYRLTEELERVLASREVEPGKVIATTFTIKAAAELRDRVRKRLVESGYPRLAEETAQALIGTVHSVCEKLLVRFAFELGLSPQVGIVSLDDSAAYLDQALDDVLDRRRVRTMNAMAGRLGIDLRGG